MTDPKRNKVEEEPSPGLHLSDRYPDPAIEVLDPSFAKYRIFNAAVDICCGATFLTIESCCAPFSGAGMRPSLIIALANATAV